MKIFLRKRQYKALALLSVLFFSCQTLPKKDDSVQKLIREGKSEEAKKRFEREDIDNKDGDGNTALHVAAQMDEADLVNFLIMGGAGREITNNDGDTPLFCAIRKDAQKAGATLTLLRANIFAKDKNGTSALEAALAHDTNGAWYKTMINSQTAMLRDTDGQSIVHYFVKTKNEKAIDYCISQHLDCAVKDKNGNTPLHLALKNPNDYDSIKIAAKLVQSGVPQTEGECGYFEQSAAARNPLLRYDDGQTPLHIASILGHSGIVDYLLKEKSTISPATLMNAQDIAGATALHEAVRYGNVEVAQKLLKAGANVNATDALGNTPILLLIPAEKQEKIYPLLISHGADTKAKDSFGDSVFHKCTMSRASVKTLSILLNSGAEINARNKDGATPLAVAIDCSIPEHVDFYASNGADIYASDRHAQTPVGRAIDSADISIFMSLLSSKENINSKDSNGNSPLHLAIQSNAPDSFVKYLVDRGADVDARNSSGDSVLLMAAQRNRKEAGERLIAGGADIFATNTQNNSPLRVSFTNKKARAWLLNEMTAQMKDGAANTPLHYAAEWKYKNAILLLFEKGADARAKNANGETAIFNAVKSDSPTIIELLAENGCPVDSRFQDARDNLGNTPLHAAVKFNSKNAAKKLVELGVDVDAQNVSGRTALADSCRAGNEELSHLLIDSGADVDATDALGRTALMDAVFQKNEKMVDLLLNAGANVSVQDISGRSAFHEAAKSGEKSIIERLKNAGAAPLARDRAGETPFSIVLSSGIDMIFAVLGRDTSLSDSDGNTPVHIAVEKGASRKVLTALLDAGFPVSQRNSNGETALSLAVKNGKSPLALALLEKGADPFVSDSTGESALSFVIKEKNRYILDAIARTNARKTDRAGDGILHYAARIADAETATYLIGLGLDKTAKNIAGETPEKLALRWNRAEIAAILSGKNAKDSIDAK